MKKAEPHQLFEITRCTDFGHSGGINARLNDRLAVIDFDPRQVVQTEHPTGAQLPNHSWNTNLFVVKKLLTKPSRILRFNPEVELTQQHTPTLTGHGRPITTPSPTGMTLQHRRHLLHHIEVEAEATIQPLPLHFEHHLPTTAQARAMHLGKRRCSQRLWIEINHLGAALAELLLQHRLNMIETEGRHVVL